MVQINPIGYPVYHRLIANKKVGEMKKGEMKDVLIAKYQDGRFAVMGLFTIDPTIGVTMDFFYELMTEDELHKTFTEQFTTLKGFSNPNES